MYCNKCGDRIEQNEFYCNKCGNYLGDETQPLLNNNNANPINNINSDTQQPITDNIASNNKQPMTNNYPININQNANQTYQHNMLNNMSGRNNKKMILTGVSIGVGVLIAIFICVIFLNFSNDNYYFSGDTYEDNEEISGSDNPTEDTSLGPSSNKKGKYKTAIIYDNTYSGIKIRDDKDAYSLISKDSTSQKDNCPSEIKAIEDEMIKKYGITAVNLCEMDISFAKELGNVFKKIYAEYPSVRGNITNLTLVNVSMADNYIAAFMPAFNFATSSSSSTYPWVIKTQVLLNTTYFLNPQRLDRDVKNGSSSGHFPPNATVYSPVAHELGHYLSFLAMMNHYKMESILLIDNSNVNTFYNLYSDFGHGDYSLSIIKEAYENYKSDSKTTLSIDEWRATISEYAVAKDNSGNYIYDETIAESFHDVYLNGVGAKDASKYVVNVLKKKLGG